MLLDLIVALQLHPHGAVLVTDGNFAPVYCLQERHLYGYNNFDLLHRYKCSSTPARVPRQQFPRYPSMYDNTQHFPKLRV